VIAFDSFFRKAITLPFVKLKLNANGYIRLAERYKNNFVKLFNKSV